MKKVIFLLLSAICWESAQSQFSESLSSIKLGGGYSKDFPGLSGYAVHGEYTYSLHEKLEGGFGMKRIHMSGYPRTFSVNEYTKATTLDFNIYFLPFTSETSVLRIGAGYSFSFYKARRSYPVIETRGTEKITNWPTQDASGRGSGVTLTAEYEYIFTSEFSIGLKGSLCKAYDRVYYIGPFVGIRL